MYKEHITKVIENTLKDYGVDWILKERGTSFADLMEEIKLALSKVLD